VSRDVRLGNLFNVRDLGGYVTADGRAVRWKRVYRAASLHQLDPAHADDWDRLGLATVVDLRRDRERASGGWPTLLNSAVLCDLPVLPDDWTLPREGFSSPTEHLSYAYDDMARLGTRAVRRTFELLAEPARYPLMFFCMAGKDRTGIMAVLLLMALGVDEEIALDDYELSGDRVVALVEHLKERDSLDRTNPMIHQPLEVLRAPRVAMSDFLGRLKAHYGSVLSYLDSCGIDEAAREAVRRQLLEPLGSPDHPEPAGRQPLAPHPADARVERLTECRYK
jgi:protein tyrosine/serine phosphatase